MNLRNNIVDEYDALVRTATQRTYELITYKQSQEQSVGKLSSADLYQRWSTHVTATTASIGEAVTQNFVDTALKYNDRILSQTKLRAMVLKMDANYGKLSPVSVMSNLAKVMERTRSPEQLSWVLQSIMDLLDTNECSPRDFTVRSLESRPDNLSVSIIIF